ncbi:MAG: hypothetical protein ACK5O7_03820 [Holosporales bacterium]
MRHRIRFLGLFSWLYVTSSIASDLTLHELMEVPENPKALISEVDERHVRYMWGKAIELLPKVVRNNSEVSWINPYTVLGSAYARSRYVYDVFCYDAAKSSDHDGKPYLPPLEESKNVMPYNYNFLIRQHRQNWGTVNQLDPESPMAQCVTYALLWKTEVYEAIRGVAAKLRVDYFTHKFMKYLGDRKTVDEQNQLYNELGLIFQQSELCHHAISTLLRRHPAVQRRVDNVMGQFYPQVDLKSLDWQDLEFPDIYLLEASFLPVIWRTAAKIQKVVRDTHSQKDGFKSFKQLLAQQGLIWQPNQKILPELVCTYAIAHASLGLLERVHGTLLTTLAPKYKLSYPADSQGRVLVSHWLSQLCGMNLQTNRKWLSLTRGLAKDVKLLPYETVAEILPVPDIADESQHNDATLNVIFLHSDSHFFGARQAIKLHSRGQQDQDFFAYELDLEKHKDAIRGTLLRYLYASARDHFLESIKDSFGYYVPKLPKGSIALYGVLEAFFDVYQGQKKDFYGYVLNEPSFKDYFPESWRESQALSEIMDHFEQKDETSCLRLCFRCKDREGEIAPLPHYDSLWRYLRLPLEQRQQHGLQVSLPVLTQAIELLGRKVALMAYVLRAAGLSKTSVLEDYETAHKEVRERYKAFEKKMDALLLQEKSKPDVEQKKKAVKKKKKTQKTAKAEKPSALTIKDLPELSTSSAREAVESKPADFIAKLGQFEIELKTNWAEPSPVSRARPLSLSESLSTDMPPVSGDLEEKLSKSKPDYKADKSEGGEPSTVSSESSDAGGRGDAHPQEEALDLSKLQGGNETQQVTPRALAEITKVPVPVDPVNGDALKPEAASTQELIQLQQDNASLLKAIYHRDAVNREMADNLITMHRHNHELRQQQTALQNEVYMAQRDRALMLETLKRLTGLSDAQISEEIRRTRQNQINSHYQTNH